MSTLERLKKQRKNMNIYGFFRKNLQFGIGYGIMIKKRKETTPQWKRTLPDSRATNTNELKD